MMDKIIITNFLNRHFKIVQIDYENGHRFLDKHLNLIITSIDLIEIIRKIFSEYITDEGETPIMFMKEWFGAYYENEIKGIDKFLADVNITLGLTDWNITKPDGSKITPKRLVKLFGDKVDSTFILNYYTDWYSTQVAIISEKMMKDGYY